MYSKPLKKIIVNLIPLDFGYLTTQVTSRSMKRHDLFITKIVETIFELAVTLKSPFRVSERKAYVWRKKHYEWIPSTVLRGFLCEVAEKLGVEHEEAYCARYANDLVYQFLHTDDKRFLRIDEKWCRESVLIALENRVVVIDANGNISTIRPNPCVKPTVTLPVKYEYPSECPLFDFFLGQVLPDRKTQLALFEFIADSMIPYSHKMARNLQKCCLLVGPCDTGKSVMANVIRAILGEDNVVRLSLAELTKPGSFLVKDLEGKTLNISSDSNSYIPSVEAFKGLVSGEAGRVDVKHHEAVEMRDYARIMIIGNNFPRVDGADDAYYKRLHIIPFRYQIPREMQDPQLATKIIDAELPAIANRVISAMATLIRYGLAESEEMRVELLRARSNHAHVGDFLAAHNYIKTEDAVTPLKVLFGQYTDFCRAEGYMRDIATSPQQLSRALIESGYTRRMVNNTAHFFLTQI